MMASPNTTRAMIAATVDEFSFMFTDIPPRLCNANDSPSVSHKNGYPPHPHRDFVIQLNEKLEAWNARTYPLSPPTSDEFSLSSSSTACRYSAIDRINPYDLYGPPTAESETPSHILLFQDQDQDRSATSSTSSQTPTSPKFQNIALETPYMDHCTAPPAYTENPYSAANMHNTNPCYIPFEYAKLPHFHPPRFSRRLRELIADRRRPMQLHLLPLHKPRNNEKQGWIIATPDSTLLPTPRNRFLAWWDSFDPRLVVFVSLMTMLFGVFIIALVVSGFLQ
ncbi:uncharacterized protein LAJ45_00247 [Morchella importuna]|uniref:uncharacterized protein n=1 Tax=Morchella importuna TaxID=1174673 RepID=UPI001E8E84E5|nr:uncharacterized protein LAJ45_00247 [Morchella importuna]KAH8155238.1 hypothetical protein LAJ45_00247 [Morchella importuna]